MNNEYISAIDNEIDEILTSNSEDKIEIPNHNYQCIFIKDVKGLVLCPICNREMRKLDSLHFICDYDHRKPLSDYNHYKQYKPEPIDLIEKYQLNFSEGCFVKYMLRCEFKRDKLGDLVKALYYLKRSKETTYRRSMSYAEISEYYDCKKFSDEHLNCLIWFISGHSFETIKKYLEKEICKVDKEKNGH